MKPGLVRSAMIAALAAAPWMISGADLIVPPILFQDDFELTATLPDGTLDRWDGPGDPSVMYLTDRAARSGRRALELRYLPGSHGSSFMYQQLLGFDQLYFRWYQRWSPGFIWEPSATK